MLEEHERLESLEMAAEINWDSEAVRSDKAETLKLFNESDSHLVSRNSLPEESIHDIHLHQPVYTLDTFLHCWDIWADNERRLNSIMLKRHAIKCSGKYTHVHTGRFVLLALWGILLTWLLMQLIYSTNTPSSNLNLNIRHEQMNSFGSFIKYFNAVFVHWDRPNVPIFSCFCLWWLPNTHTPNSPKCQKV